jgi:hypothetical protein
MKWVAISVVLCAAVVPGSAQSQDVVVNVPGTARDVVWSPDGKSLAICTVAPYGVTHVDARSGRELFRYASTGTSPVVCPAAFSSDGLKIAAGGPAGTKFDTSPYPAATILDAQSGRVEGDVQLRPAPQTTAFPTFVTGLGSGGFVLGTFNGKNVHLVDAKTQTVRKSLESPLNSRTRYNGALAAGKSVVLFGTLEETPATWTGGVEVRDAATFNVLRTIRVFQNEVKAAATGRKGRIYVTGPWLSASGPGRPAEQPSVKSINLETGAIEATFALPAPAMSLSFAPGHGVVAQLDDKHLLLLSEDLATSRDLGVADDLRGVTRVDPSGQRMAITGAGRVLIRAVGP